MSTSWTKELIRAFVAAAIILLASAAHTQPEHKVAANDLLFQAREAAAADQHKEAIELYRRAIKLNPLLFDDVALELGHQYTWAEMPHSAIASYRIYLNAHPGNIEAEMGIARALSWDDRLDEAELYYQELLAGSGDHRGDVLAGVAKVKSWENDLESAEKMYREILAADPANEDAKLGLAEVTNWSGRHRRAQDMYKEILERDPDNTEALKGMAFAKHWVGRSDQAIDVISGRKQRDLLLTAKAIESSRHPHGSHVFSHKDNSDDGEIDLLRNTFRFSPTYLTSFNVTYTKGKLTDTGFSDIDRDEVILSLYKRFSSTLALTANPGYQWNRFDATTVPATTRVIDQLNLAVWDVYATVTPHDWLRIDIGNARETISAPLAILNEIDVITSSAGLDWRLHHQILTKWNARYHDYSDANARFTVSQELEWTPRWRLPYAQHHYLVVLEGIGYYNFQKQVDHGYFNPTDYIFAYGGLRYFTNIGRRVTFDINGRVGPEREGGGDWIPVGAFEAIARLKLGQQSYLSAGYNRSRSSLGSPGGFESEGFFLSIDYTIPR